jgi:hypothetical protein
MHCDPVLVQPGFFTNLKSSGRFRARCIISVIDALRTGGIFGVAVVAPLRGEWL